jgi:hypothetical protein
MANLKLFASVVLAAGLSSLPLTAQQSPSPATTQQPSSGQTVPGNHSDPTAEPQTTPGESQKPTNDSPGTTQETGNGNSSAAEPVQHTASAPEVSNAELRPVRAELVGKLDSKSAKAGDKVVLKTTDNATIADGTVIPKGSKIEGTVVDVKPHDDTNRNSQVTLQFTQAELKGGQTVPIKSVLQSVSPAEAISSASEYAPTPSGTMGGGGAQGGAPTWAGGSAGSAGANSGMNGSAGASRSQTAEAQGSMGAAQSSAGAAPGANGAPAPGTVVAQQGNVQVKTTAVPGVLVEAKADGQPFSNASGALLGAGRNVHLDGGTKVDLAIAQATEKPGQR